MVYRFAYLLLKQSMAYLAMENTSRVFVGMALICLVGSCGDQKASKAHGDVVLELSPKGDGFSFPVRISAPSQNQNPIVPLVDRSVTIFKCDVGQTLKEDCIEVWKRATGKEFVRQLELSAGVTTFLASLYLTQKAYDDAMAAISLRLDDRERPLTPESRVEAQSQLDLLQANIDKLRPVFEITKVLTLDGETSVASFDKPAHGLLVSAIEALPEYTAQTTGLSVNFADSRTGLVWKRIHDVCFYNASDVAVPKGQGCFIPSKSHYEHFQERSGHHILLYKYFLRDPNKGLATAETKGCHLGYGMSLPGLIEYSTISDRWDMNLTWLSDGSVSPLEESLKRTTGMYSWLELKALRDAWSSSQLPKSVAIGVSCFAGAEVLFPDEDLDQDGVPNRDDRCIHSPRDLKDIKFVELNNNERRGCAASQKVNEEFRKNGYSDLGTSQPVGTTTSSKPTTWTLQDLGMGRLEISSLNISGQVITTLQVMSLTKGGIAQNSEIILKDHISQVDGQNIKSVDDFLKKLNLSYTKTISILRMQETQSSYSTFDLSIRP